MVVPEVLLIIYPFTVLVRILSLNVRHFSFSHSKVMLNQSGYSITLIILKVIVLVTHILLLYSFLRDLEEVKGFAKASVIHFLMKLRVLGYFVIMVVVSIVTNVQFGAVLSQARKMVVLDEMLTTEMSQGPFLKRYNKECARKANILTASILGYAILSMVPWRSWEYFFLSLYPRMALSTIKYLFCVLSLMLEKRFRILNNLLKTKKLESEKSHKYPPDCNFVYDIEKIVTIHENIVEVSMQMNECYGFQLLMCITLDFVLLIGDLHTTMYIILFKLSQKYQFLLFEIVRHTIHRFFELYYLAKCSTQLCYQANHTKIVILGIRIHVDKEEERDAVIVATLKLMRNKLEITACKLFNLDNTLLFSICGAASSYLFIMLQLDMGEANLIPPLLNVTNSSHKS